MIEDRDPNIYKGNDYMPRIRLEKDDETTGLPVPATGIADLDLWISATEDGATIHATLKVRLTELAERQGTYQGPGIPGSSITTQLFGAGASDFAGKPVYVIAANVAQNIRGVERVKAMISRRLS